MTNPDLEGYKLVFNKIEIYGLFGMYDYENLTFKTKDGILILYGLNGMGKTTILKLIHQYKEGEFEAIANISFKKIIIVFDVTPNNTELGNSIKTEIEKFGENQVRFTFYLTDNIEPTLTIDLAKKETKRMRHLNDYDSRAKMYE